MTENREFIGKRDVNLTDGFRAAKGKYEEMEKIKAEKILEDPGEVRKKAEELLDRYRRDAKRPEMINVIERNIRIFEEIEANYEEIVSGLAKTYGTDKVDFVLYLFKVRHPCFHLRLETNTVAINPEIKKPSKSSEIELTSSLKRSWEELHDLIHLGLGKTEIIPILLEEYFEDLRLALEEHKEQLQYIRGVEPKFLSKCRLDPNPHLTVGMGWDFDGRNIGAFYSDLLDLENSVENEGLRDQIRILPLQILRPIIVESDRWEVIPLIIPISLKEMYPSFIEDIKERIEKRLQGCGEIRKEEELKFSHEIVNASYSSPETLLKVVEARKIGSYDIRTINEILRQQVFRADIEINCGIENYSGRGVSSESRNAMERRDTMYSENQIIGENLSCGQKIDIPQKIKEIYIKKFDNLKREILGT